MIFASSAIPIWINLIEKYILQLVRQRNSSSGSYFAYGSETRKILSFEGSTGNLRMLLNFVLLVALWKYLIEILLTDEGSDKTLELTCVGEDAASSTASSRPEEIFQESQVIFGLFQYMGNWNQ